MWAIIYCEEKAVHGSVSGIRTSGSRCVLLYGSEFPTSIFMVSVYLCLLLRATSHLSRRKQSTKANKTAPGREVWRVKGSCNRSSQEQGQRRGQPAPATQHGQRGVCSPKYHRNSPVLYLQPQSRSLSFVLYTIFRSKTLLETFFSHVPTTQSRMQPVPGFKRDQPGR